MLCLGERRHFVGFSVELMGFWVAKGIVQYQKNFKRQSITPKVLPEFRDEALMTPIPTKVPVVRPSRCTTKRLTDGVYHFP